MGSGEERAGGTSALGARGATRWILLREGTGEGRDILGRGKTVIFLPAHHHVLPTLPMVHTFDCPHSPAACRWFFQHIIIGTDFCHKMGVVNRDMKLENIILQVLHSVGRSISHACMHACMAPTPSSGTRLTALSLTSCSSPAQGSSCFIPRIKVVPSLRTDVCPLRPP